MKELVIVHLYPAEMNLYGDTGNRLVLEKRLEWRGLPYRTVLLGTGQKMPASADIILGGGGQDASQGGIERDLREKRDELYALGKDGAVMLMICGMYQLMGRHFITTEGVTIKGLDIMPHETRAGEGRLIGNITAEVEGAGLVVGYENHSGRTYLDEDAIPLGRVIKGAGNNDDSGHEGCRFRNIIGTYMHGPVLAKNPRLADLLLELAYERHGLKHVLAPLDDTLEDKAREVASHRPR